MYLPQTVLAVLNVLLWASIASAGTLDRPGRRTTSITETKTETGTEANPAILRRDVRDVGGLRVDVGSQIGRGKYSTVYAGRVGAADAFVVDDDDDDDDGGGKKKKKSRDVAVKHCVAVLNHCAEEVRKQREVHARLPHVALAVLGSGEADGGGGSMWIAMPLAAGTLTLTAAEGQEEQQQPLVAEYAGRGGAPGEEKLADVLALWESLVELHAAGWWHGDLRADNVAVLEAWQENKKKKEGGLRPFRLLDFALAGRFDPGGGHVDVMAAAVARELRTDVARLAQVTHALVFGRLPDAPEDPFAPPGAHLRAGAEARGQRMSDALARFFETFTGSLFSAHAQTAAHALQFLRDNVKAEDMDVWV